jgi:gas vesicle protein
MSENSNGSVIPGLCAAFAVGALVGAGVALLYAPRSGKETRELVCRKARGLKDAAAEALAQGKHLAGTVQDQAGEVFEEGKQAARKIGDAATRSA